MSRRCTRKTKRQVACFLIVFIMAISPPKNDRALFRSPSPSRTAHSKTPTGQRLGFKQPKHNRKRVSSGPCRRLHAAVELTHAPAFTLIPHIIRARVPHIVTISCISAHTHKQQKQSVNSHVQCVLRVFAGRLYTLRERVCREATCGFYS